MHHRAVGPHGWAKGKVRSGLIVKSNQIQEPKNKWNIWFEHKGSWNRSFQKPLLRTPKGTMTISHITIINHIILRYESKSERSGEKKNLDPSGSGVVYFLLHVNAHKARHLWDTGGHFTAIISPLMTKNRSNVPLHPDTALSLLSSGGTYT